jgi:uncharacterized pyridoxamine 5'-phosphate oxidase family protein
MSDIPRYEITRVASFAEIADEVVERAQRGPYASMATVDPDGRPQTRIVHPVWDGEIIWISAFPGGPKARHIAANPWVSLAWTTETWTPMYAECRAEYVDEPATKAAAWDTIRSIPEPLGFDPAPIYGTPDDPRFALLRLTPWKIRLGLAPGKLRIWQAD